MSNQQDGGAPETRRGKQRPQAEGFGFRIVRAAGAERVVEAGKASRAYPPRRSWDLGMESTWQRDGGRVGK